MSTSYSDPPVKRKRGRPPKKQPLDVYMSFTSQFQALSSSSSPSAESNSNLMIKLGEPNSFTPVMKVSPSKPIGKRRRKSIAILTSSSSSSGKLQSPGSLSGSCSPSLKKYDIGLPTPLTVRSQVSHSSAVNLRLDDKVYDNMQKIFGFEPEKSYQNLSANDMSTYEVPLASPQLTPRLSLSSTQSDMEMYCRSLKLSPVKDDTGVNGGFDESSETKSFNNMNCPEPCLSFVQDEDAFPFNLVIDDRGHAAFSLDMPEESVRSSHLQPTTPLQYQEPKPYADEFSFSNGYSSAGHYLIPPTLNNKNTEVVGSEIFHDNQEDILDSKFPLTPHFNSSMNSMININSPLRPLMSGLYLDSGNIPIRQQPATNSMSNTNTSHADASNLYKTVNINNLPCSEGGDARAALRRAVQKH